MRRAIATVSLSGTLRQKLEAIAAAGFDAYELFEPDFIAYNGDARELRRIGDDLGLALDLYQPLRDVEGMPEAMFRRTLERAERKFELMATLGAPLLLVCSNTSPAALPEPGRAAEQLHALAERAARHGLRIGYEALAWGRWVNRYGQAWSIVEQAGHGALGLILDSFHTLSLNDDPAGIAAIPGEKLYFVQMADAPLMAMDVLQWARHHRNFPAQGQLDVVGFFEQALRAGYRGTLSLEIFNDVFRATPNRRIALDAMRSLLFLESQVRERLQRAADAPARGALERVALFDPPAPSAVDGIAFIEFAVDAAHARTLAALFVQLGFEHAGRHRTKAVDWYRQRDIHLVINAQADSEARSRFDDQGPCVCALGLMTAEPARAADRAAALRSARHDSPRGPDEALLPAIVSPGGMVLHFMPDAATFESDFVAPADAPRAAMPVPGLRAVDHVALGLANDQFDTWMLFGRAVLGLERGDSLELADPFGLIRSVGVANRERSLRFVLNVSLSERTRTAQQVRSSGRSGGSVHHIALGSDDVVASVRALRANGVRFVPISANYYDDLLARTGLPDARVRELQALDILYDESARGGHYLHAYTEPYAERFFFEIVQRADYDAYGAVNAFARVAAQ